MKEWLVFAAEQAIIVIDAMALIIVLVGTVEAFFSGIRVMFSSRSGHEGLYVWLRHARWLIAGLTFLLAADIIETAITPSWEDIGRIAAIAAIRTALDYFLERDLDEIRERQRKPAETPT